MKQNTYPVGTYNSRAAAARFLAEARADAENAGYDFWLTHSVSPARGVEYTLWTRRAAS